MKITDNIMKRNSMFNCKIYEILDEAFRISLICLGKVEFQQLFDHQNVAHWCL